MPGVSIGSRVVGPAPSHVLETEIGDEISLYDPTTEQVTILNGTASDIWRLADGEHTLNEITELLASAYQVPPSEIANEVTDTVNRLIEASLLISE